MIGFTVSDMDRAVDFYERVLGIQKRSPKRRSPATRMTR